MIQNHTIHAMGDDIRSTVFRGNDSREQFNPVIPNLSPSIICFFLDLHIIADVLNPSFCVPIQPVDEVSESRNFFFNSQITIRFGRRSS